MNMQGCVARIYRPILTEDERAKRMKAISKAAEKVLKEAMKGEMNAKVI
jgi:shikimate kinase